jgi:hypothetical protein
MGFLEDYSLFRGRMRKYFILYESVYRFMTDNIMKQNIIYTARSKQKIISIAFHGFAR